MHTFMGRCLCVVVSVKPLSIISQRTVEKQQLWESINMCQKYKNNKEVKCANSCMQITSFFKKKYVIDRCLVEAFCFTCNSASSSSKCSVSHVHRCCACKRKILGFHYAVWNLVKLSTGLRSCSCFFNFHLSYCSHTNAIVTQLVDGWC